MNYKFQNPDLPIDERVSDLLKRLTTAEKISLMTHEAQAVPRLGIPEYNWWNECLHGLGRSAPATVFPQAIAMAATFDTDLMYRIGDAISEEARAVYHHAINRDVRRWYMGLTFWSPNINIFRDPRWGRGHETYGEDPYLTGEIGAAFVKGLQGDDPDYYKVTACAKHYAVHNGPEYSRHTFNAKPTKKDMNETYLPAFKKLIDSGVAGVMCAYNRLDDEACCGSQALLLDLLRDKWKFNGYLVSDCWALNDFHTNHKVTADAVESAALALKKEVNVNCGVVYKNLGEAIEKGLISEADLDKALRTQLKIRFKLGMFDPADRVPYSSIKPDVIHSKEHVDLSREAAQKSMVLLKNKKNILPLNKDLTRIYVTGNNAADVNVLLGNYHGISGNLVTFVEGIAGRVSPSTIVHFNQGILLNQKADEVKTGQIWNSMNADAVIAVVGLSPLLEGEEGDATASPDDGDRDKIELPESQMLFLKNLRKACGETPMIVVICAGSAVAMPEVHEMADAVIWAWYPGEQGGNALADIIFGDVSPSGRLPVTIYNSTEQLGEFEDYRIAEGGRTYKYFQKEPLYPFGFGLSYNKYVYSNLKVSKETVSSDEQLAVSVKVTNNGPMPGDEVIQLYLSAMEVPFITPLNSLSRFKRISLAVGESKTIEFVLNSDDLKLIDNEGNAVFFNCTMNLSVGACLPCSRALNLGIDQTLTRKIILE